MLALLLVGAGASSALSQPAPSGTYVARGKTAADPPVRLRGHVLAQLPEATATPFNAAAPEHQITLTVTLNRTDPVGFEAYVAGVVAGTNPTLGMNELTARFGPTPEAYQAVLDYFEQSGFSLVRTSSNRLILTVRGTRARAEKAFAVTIRDYQLNGRTFFANDQDPAVPASIAGLILGISGLNNLGIHNPAATAPNPALPQSIATAYGAGALTSDITGQGQTIALIEYDNYDRQDVAQWLAFAGLLPTAMNHLTSVSINGGTGISGGSGTLEALGDIATIMGIAPGANIITVVGPNGTSDETAIDAAWAQVVGADGRGGIVSTSWFNCEREVSDSDADSLQLLVRSMTASGTSFFALTGDNGATCVNGGSGTRYANRIAYPGGVPDAVAVGGTNLQVIAGNAYAGESWWTSGDNGGGFGTSWHFSRPAYQASHTSAPGRSVPDVSADADPNTGFKFCQSGNCTIGFGGTSMSTPIWAATWALVCQARALGPLGATCPSANAGFLYSLQPSAFHQAGTMGGLGNDFVHVGLGSPNIAGLAAQVAGPPAVTGLEPAAGPVTGGTSVTITGSNFVGVTSVVFEGAGNAAFTVSSTGEITATSPALTNFNIAGKKHVIVTTLAGTSEDSDANVFNYQPVIVGISPQSGPMSGGTAVTVTGFNIGTQIKFDGILSPNVHCSSDSECLAATPPHAPGTVDVTVSDSPPSPNARFNYETQSISRIDPKIGPETGGIYVYVYGSGFAQGIGVDPSIMSIDFCPASGPCTSSPYVTCSDSTWCTAWMPAGSGTVDIVARASNGVSSDRTAADRFTYAPFPTIAGVFPVSGVATGGTTVSLTGTNFSTAAGATAFHFGANAAVDVACDLPTHCTATSPPGTGTVDVTAAVGGATGSPNQADTFAYIPVVTGVSPGSGSAIGGTAVTVTGAGFVDRDPFGLLHSGLVSFGPSPATGTCSDASTCQVVDPSGVGTVDVAVTTGEETSAAVPADKFTYAPAGSPKGWTKWNVASMPQAFDALAYDAGRKRAVSFGSVVINTTVNPCPPPEELPPGAHCNPPPPKFIRVAQTWTWAVDGSGWTQLSPAVQPHPTSHGQSMAFHAASGKTVMFGGEFFVGVSATGPVGNATWVWDGTTWSDANPATSPPPRFDATMAYDAVRQVLILFGGCSTPYCTARLNDTWAWDGGTWKEQTPMQAPPPRSSARLAFDEETGRAVLFGGEDSNGVLGDTWLWDGSTWTQQNSTGAPPPRRNAAMAGIAPGLVLFGGIGSGGLLTDTWEFNGETWVQLHPPVSPALAGLTAVDTDSHEVVCLCGQETWTWGGE